MSHIFFEILHENQTESLVLHGDWVLSNSNKINKELANFPPNITSVDARAVGRIDLWGLIRLQSLIERTNARLEVNDEQRRMLDFLPMEQASLSQSASKISLAVGLIEAFGRFATNAVKTLTGMMSLVGEIAIVFMRCVGRPRSFRFHSIVRHIEETGIRAMPIVGLLAILISMVISYQAATQLQRFGASIFTVDLTVISILREMGVLITAIMVAGRSGSAFAAEIGVMKLREEVDALKTMGFNPVEILVLPRVIAMMLVLPILTFLANIMGLAGGGIVSSILLDIPLSQYIDRVATVATPTMFFVGMIKAPVFAFAIAIVGTYQGMNVSGSAESVGRLTTVAVVQSIFLVIMLDALFSIIFSQLGI
jgi:phospholipid/cholesterol/gamma-HCH transport system permease protein